MPSMVGLYDVRRWSKGSRRPYQEKESRQPSIHVISDGITRLPILEGEISQIELPRPSTSSLGLTIVGGADTPLRCIVIQEVFPDGLAALDGRLQPGDQIIEVDDSDMTTATHQQVCRALKRSTSPVLRLGIYRERIEAYRAASPSVVASPASSYGEVSEEILNVTLRRECSRHLGIKVACRRSEPGIYIIELTPNSTAEHDGRLRVQDRLLVINGEDIRFSKLEHSSRLIQQSGEYIHLILSRSELGGGRRRTRSLSQDSIFGSDGNEHSGHFSGSSSDQNSTCSAVEEEPAAYSDSLSDRSASSPSVLCSSVESRTTKTQDGLEATEEEGTYIYESFKPRQEVWKCKTMTPASLKANGLSQVFGFKKELGRTLQKKQVILYKKSGEGLGMRIGGGLRSNEGDAPIYVANINSNGPAGKSRQIKKGDVVLSVEGESLLGLTHSQAVALLKSTSESTTISLALLEGPESSAGRSNFVPSWLYWQYLPRSLHISKTVLLHRAPGASLGFSIVGGNDPNRGPEPIHVLFVVATSPASVDGRLRCGDRILAVDGRPLSCVSHAAAVDLLKQAGTTVHLEVLSWLGTEL